MIRAVQGPRLTDSKDSQTFRTDTQTPANMTLSRRVPWEGMREFAVKQEDNTVRLQYSGGKAEFVFTPEGMTYSIGGQVVRVWHRVKGQ